MYSIYSYFFSKFLIEIPHLIISPLIFSLIVYFGVGLTITSGQFWMFFFILIMVVFDAHSYGYFLSAMFDNSIIAAQISPLFAVPMMLVGGMLCNAGTMSPWISWLQYLSPIRYGYEALVWN
jgi:ABC-type multidrug transport system permease subunit